jgi:hypothetical protein
MYYRYNGKYWEQDWAKKEWNRLPDLYSVHLAPEIEALARQDTT